MDGIVKNFFVERSVGLITGDNGVEYFVIRKWVQADRVTGRRYLIRGELVTFDASWNSEKRRNNAINVVPLNRPLDPLTPTILNFALSLNSTARPAS